MSRATCGFLLGAALALAGQGCALPTPSSVVMVSGRDDHGLVERPALGLARSPTDATVAGSVRDGTFVRIVGSDGTWRLVETIDAKERGWIDDHYLRGDAVRHDVSPPAQVTLVDARVEGGAVVVRVREKRGGAEAWVAAASLREIGARDR